LKLGLQQKAAAAAAAEDSKQSMGLKSHHLRSQLLKARPAAKTTSNNINHMQRDRLNASAFAK
jgi:hypothetical protein